MLHRGLDTGTNGDGDNKLIRKALRKKAMRMTETEYIRAKLIAAEQSVKENGWVEETQDEILAGIKEKARADDKL